MEKITIELSLAEADFLADVLYDSLDDFQEHAKDFPDYYSKADVTRFLDLGQGIQADLADAIGVATGTSPLGGDRG